MQKLFALARLLENGPPDLGWNQKSLTTCTAAPRCSAKKGLFDAVDSAW
jgi:hypothetical protein